MTNLIRFSPTSDMRRLQREIDTLFESFFPHRTPNENGESAVWTPRVDLSETEEAYFIHLDLPGLNKEDLEINYQDGSLTISGERKAEATDENRKYVRIERSYGRFFRSFSLPQAIQEGGIEANFRNGVLDITVPKAEEVKPRRIEVK